VTADPEQYFGICYFWGELHRFHERFEFVKQVGVVLHKLKADSANYLSIKSRVKDEWGIFDFSASNGAEKVSLFGVMEADGSFLRNSLLSVVTDAKTSPADIEDFIGTSVKQGLDSLQRGVLDGPLLSANRI
jgi:hypothetical protein